MQTDVRSKLIEAFSKADGKFISGQEIAEYIGCSRTAVWKHIEDLRSEGYVLEAVRKKGYQIVSKPEKVTANEIKLGLQTKIFGKSVHYEESVESTQKIAHRLAGDGASEGTLVVAEEQTFGKGRLSRSWHSPKHTGVWMSLILRPNIPFHQAPQLTLLTAVAVVQGIEEATDLMPGIKWPNDILINQKKVTGILTELQAEADRIHSVIIGIGINVNQKNDDFPEDLRQKASSLFIESGQPVSRARLIQHILAKMEQLYQLYLDKGFTPIKILWESYAVSLGKEIKASTLTETLYGKALGITDEGVLLLEDNAGQIHTIYSADIEIP
ncbi:biotin--[acetyl-CoA-carboxylase] ligase [Peribacillus cavernae]|uniref:Bifunctional ligase/repressor BirA n=1 Tax=Peribacillus cavernae TaxID=1674310 RepID=A0A433HLS1_9BACI|nr:biotin--[acetyl-CoA-carboxylase] ligase [Peribacillus cavernae]MDQ0218964.1 BirA family biotin operon repressor/biotin-[acetyl-CoA-carboxylase] ligase [Peribacillus cavernae]RUQ29328.1 biotin--[acetyl-CoA-carboxylase] ligase [Peribacillus cavernae]